jgi:DNA polymerase-3 subunit alpha
LVVGGRVDHRGDDVKLIAQQVTEPDLSPETVVRLRVSATRLSPDMVGKLRRVLTNHPGTAPVFLHMTGEGDDTVVRLGEEHRVEPRTALFAELRELLGPTAILR